MSKVIRRAAAVILAIAMALPCVTAFAADSTTTKVVEVDSWASSSTSRDKNGKTRTEGSETWVYLPLHNPASVKASGSGTKITIKAETTTMPKYVQIQYGKDKTFKSGVTTKKLNNTKYNGKQALFTIDGAWKESKKNEEFKAILLTATIKGSQRLFSVQEKKVSTCYCPSKTAAIRFIKLPLSIEKSREKTKASGTYTITGVKNPSAYYVRVRNVYEYNGKTYYSAWKTVKVQSANNKVSSAKSSK